MRASPLICGTGMNRELPDSRHQFVAQAAGT